MKEKITVIVPVYNSEKHLQKCVESLTNQTYKNLEIILVDDGSTDKSLNICKTLSKKDNRIKVIHKINGGVSSARNVGIDNATGDYIAFVDSDDYVDLKMYEELLHSMKMNGCMIAICNVKYEDIEGNELVINEFKNEIFDKKTYAHKMYYNNCIQGFTWNKLYNRKLINNKNKIKFNENINILEDDLFNYHIIANNTNFNIIYINKKMYHYVQNQNSLSNKKFSRQRLGLFFVRKNEIEILENQDINANHLKIDYCANFIRCRYFIKDLKMENDKAYKEIQNQHMQYKSEIRFTDIPLKMKVKYLVVKFFPFIYKLKIIFKKEKC